MLYELCAKVWAKETVPEEFVLGLMVMVHKKGDTNDLMNYRPICLLSHAYNIMSTLILKRMSADI